MGNRTVQTQTITSTLVTNYTYDNANRLTSVNGVTYAWDDNGNLLNDGMVTYAYDQANRLKQVTQGANTYTFAYNGVGDRLHQTVNDSPTRYVLDPGAGLTQVLADGTNTYLYGNGRLAQYQGSMQYFGADGLGSVRQLYDASGQVIATNRYDPYGNVLAQNGTATSVFGYTGEQQDGYIKLLYLRARWYDDGTGRFTQPDPIIPDYAKAQSLNRFAYVYNNPVNLTDPSGQDPWDLNYPDDPYDPDCIEGGELFNARTGEWVWKCFQFRSEQHAQFWQWLPGMPHTTAFNPLTGKDQNLGGYISAYYVMPGVEAYNQVMLPLADVAASSMPGGGSVYNWYLSGSERHPFTGLTLSEEERKSRAVSGALSFAGDSSCFFPVAGGFLKRLLPNLLTSGSTGARITGDVERMTGGQRQMLKEVMSKYRIDVGEIEIVYAADMPKGTTGMTLGRDAFALGPEAFASESELIKSIAHELDHLHQRNLIGDPGAYGVLLERLAKEAERLR